MDDTLDPPTDIDPYQVLEIETTATANDVRSAYKKLALKHHPDKAQPDGRDTAHVKFQEIALAYAILCDERRRKRYDATGNTSESLDIDDDDFNWTDFFRAQWADAVTSSKLHSFKSNYQGSAEERRDVLAAYTSSKGDLNSVFNAVMLSNPLDDEETFREYIDRAIEAGEVEGHDAYTNEKEAEKMSRHLKAKREAAEAEKHAKILGLNGVKKSSKRGSTKNEEAGLADLADLIQQRNKGRAANFLDDLEAKYAAPKKGGVKLQSAKKRKYDEPPEEAFQKTGARQKKRKTQVKVEQETEEEEEEDHNDEDDLEDDSLISEEAKPAKGKKKGAKVKKGTKRSTRRTNKLPSSVC